MKLLSICVPTYNRVKDLAELSEHFLVKALDAYPDEVDVVVCDNSDEARARENRLALDSRIRYFKNEDNLGFGGNILRCGQEAASPYMWIISDDDPIFWDGFVELMRLLPAALENDADCIMLPFQTVDLFGTVSLSNRPENWGLKDGARISDLLAKGIIPFILFSGVVIRRNADAIPVVKANYLKNDYVQVIFFLEMLRPDSRLMFAKKTVIDYQPEYDTRFTFQSLVSSLDEVRRYVRRKFALDLDDRTYYRFWLVWLFRYGSGLYSIKDAGAHKWSYMRRLPANLSLKNSVLGMILLLPDFMIAKIHMLYMCQVQTRSQGKWTFRAFAANMDRYSKFLAERRARR